MRDISDALLRMYSELVVDCAVFESDRGIFWDAVKPLLERTKYFVLHVLKESDANDNFFCVSLLRAIGYIFVHRRNHFLKACINRKFLVDIFARKNLWMNNQFIPFDERIALSYSLRSAGILSLLHADGDLPHAGGDASEKWPFHTRSRLATFAMNIPRVRSLLSVHLG